MREEPMRTITFFACVFLPVAPCFGDPPVRAPVRIKDGGTVESVAFSPKQDKVAVLQDVKRVMMIRLFSFPSLNIQGQIKLTTGLTCMAFSPCGKYFALNGHPGEPATVRIWDVHSDP